LLDERNFPLNYENHKKNLILLSQYTHAHTHAHI